MQPHVLLLDEPTNALDPRSQVWLLDVLEDWKQRGAHGRHGDPRPLRGRGVGGPHRGALGGPHHRRRRDSRRGPPATGAAALRQPHPRAHAPARLDRPQARPRPRAPTPIWRTATEAAAACDNARAADDAAADGRSTVSTQRRHARAARSAPARRAPARRHGRARRRARGRLRGSSLRGVRASRVFAPGVVPAAALHLPPRAGARRPRRRRTRPRCERAPQPGAAVFAPQAGSGGWYWPTGTEDFGSYSGFLAPRGAYVHVAQDMRLSSRATPSTRSAPGRCGSRAPTPAATASAARPAAA